MHDWYLTHGYMHAHMKGPTETIRSHASSRRLPASCETRLKPLCDRSPPAQATPEPSRNPRDPVCVSGLDHFTGPAAGPCVIGWAARWTTSWSGSRTGLFRWGGGGIPKMDGFYRVMDGRKGGNGHRESWGTREDHIQIDRQMDRHISLSLYVLHRYVDTPCSDFTGK